ncbi:hypothetical protein [Nocardia jinanensis]|uniref:Uncharacterized protein n=1 Tax=Nocardia jinanensis TaxID=382504 RepID=A0A917RRT9_9NOCA|nr:hypothetical protein [Nocardia jinanensis]GGL20604.1 hypothetical protein GCM10011588_39290 [Nocardia jinanensis]
MNRKNQTSTRARTAAVVPIRREPDTVEEARTRLAVAFDFPLGPVREKRITDAVLALITLEIRRRNPAITTVLFDWAPYGGLGVAGFRSHDGNAVHDHELDLDITHYASDIRAADNPALTRTLQPPGLFRLDMPLATGPTNTARPIALAPIYEVKNSVTGDQLIVYGRASGHSEGSYLVAHVTGTGTVIAAPRIQLIHPEDLVAHTTDAVDLMRHGQAGHATVVRANHTTGALRNQLPT